jgi:hypothetical protein
MKRTQINLNQIYVALLITVCIVLPACTKPQPTEVGVASPASSVLLGEAELKCTIDSRQNGVQKVVVTKGGGLEFDAVVSPIVDGILTLKSPNEGATYRFTSHLAQPATGNIPGLGKVTIDKLDTKVSVDLSRYKQPNGPGTALSFESGEMSVRGNYIDFVGSGKTESGEDITFHINFGAASAGSGQITPTDANQVSRLLAKTVNIQGAMASVIVSKAKIEETSR